MDGRPAGGATDSLLVGDDTDLISATVTFANSLEAGEALEF